MPGEKMMRIADGHPTFALVVEREPDGEIVVIIGDRGLAVHDNESGEKAWIEFCASGGRSPHTRQALFALMEAMRQDNEEHPIHVEGSEEGSS